jgi:hypothetical protein
MWRRPASSGRDPAAPIGAFLVAPKLSFQINMTLRDSEVEVEVGVPSINRSRVKRKLR